MRTHSLKVLAALSNPFEEMEALLPRLLQCTSESKHLEWKATLPSSSNSTARTKYRTVKAAISFANWEGGFVVFGVAPDGSWIGLEGADAAQVDAAHIVELINGCVFPDIPDINYARFTHAGRAFTILHIPPSSASPHVTTKEVIEKAADGKQKTVLAKHMLYCRQGAKSDLATPYQHQRIVAKRLELLREETLRRVREVEVPVYDAARTGAAVTVPVAFRITSDPAAPPVRVSSDGGEAHGMLVHESLSDSLFDRVANVLQANTQLAGGPGRFVMGSSVYYRIYSLRTETRTQAPELEMLVRTAISGFYAPFLFWFNRLPPEICARIIVEGALSVPQPNCYSLFYLARLLGDEAFDYIVEQHEHRWANYTQPPERCWTLKRLRHHPPVLDRRLLAIRPSASHTLSVPGIPRAYQVTELLDAPEVAASLLSTLCKRVSEDGGTSDIRAACRSLDFIAHGTETALLAPAIIAKLEEVARTASSD